MGEPSASDGRDGGAEHTMAFRSRVRDTSEPPPSNVELEGPPRFEADAFVTTLFSGAPAELADKTWWLFRTMAQESMTGFRSSATGATFQLPLPPWSSSITKYASCNTGTAMQTMPTEHIKVPLLHFKQDAFNFIKGHLESPFKDIGDSVMATISSLMLLEAASWETNPDALLAIVMHLNGLVTAANHHCGPVVTAELTVFQKFLGMAIGSVTRTGVKEQLSTTVSSVKGCAPRSVLFIGLSSKPTGAWWCVDGNASTNSNRGLLDLSAANRGQRRDPGVAITRMIAYMYLSLVLRPGRMSNEILECLIDSIGRDTERLERNARNDSAEQSVLFWSLMLSSAALASTTPLPGVDGEKLGSRKRAIGNDLRGTSAMLRLHTWHAAVAVLKKVAFVEFEGEQELKQLWEEAVCNAES